MKTMHLHFTVDPTPEVQARLMESAGSYGADISIGEIEHTVFFNSPEARAAWLSGIRAQIDAALEATTTIPDEALPAAQVAI